MPETWQLGLGVEPKWFKFRIPFWGGLGNRSRPLKKKQDVRGPSHSHPVPVAVAGELVAPFIMLGSVYKQTCQKLCLRWGNFLSYIT